MTIGEGLRVPVQTRSQRTRSLLVEAARAEFNERGYAVTTAKSIAARANVGTGTFYHYFPDKDAVLREIAVERVQDLVERSLPLTEAPVRAGTLGEVPQLIADARERLLGLARIHVTYHRSEQGLHAVLNERRSSDPELDGVMTRAEQTAVYFLAETLRRYGRGGDAQVAAFMMFSLLEGAVHTHVLGHAVVSDAEFESGLVEAMLRVAVPDPLVPALAGPAGARPS